MVRWGWWLRGQDETELELRSGGRARGSGRRDQLRELCGGGGVRHGVKLVPGRRDLEYEGGLMRVTLL